MGLSSILNIAIALIFIYLIVSLLASQIQELIATVLQWRAVHIKESIEGLLSGNSDEDSELIKVRTLANEIYRNPVIKDLNRTARGIASLPRFLDRFLSFRKGEEKLFGEASSAPSYISKEDFTTSLFETLGISTKMQLIIKSKLNTFIESEIDILRKNKDLNNDELSLELEKFTKEKDEIFGNFDNRKIKLNDVLDHLVEIAIDVNPEFFNLSPERKKMLLERVTPSLVEVVEEISKNMPDSMKESLSSLARRSQDKVEDLEKQLSQFQKDVEDWFDKSMDRASGVYKRNAKLIAFLLGLTIAIAGNVDSIHMVDRIAKDQALQSSLNRAADNIVANQKDLSPETIAKINAEAEKISLPVGWDKSVTEEQQKRSIYLLNIIPISSLFLTFFGWIISAIAISMGSSFWFDLLGKVINVKNIGKVPNSTAPNSVDSSSKPN